MKRLVSDIALFALLFFLSTHAFCAKMVCGADNNQNYELEIQNGSHGEFIEETKWIGGKKAGITQKIVVKNVKKPSFSDDYIRFTDGTYTVTYALRCAYE